MNDFVQLAHRYFVSWDSFPRKIDLVLAVEKSEKSPKSKTHSFQKVKNVTETQQKYQKLIMFQRKLILLAVSLKNVFKFFFNFWNAIHSHGCFTPFSVDVHFKMNTQLDDIRVEKTMKNWRSSKSWKKWENVLYSFRKLKNVSKL